MRAARPTTLRARAGDRAGVRRRTIGKQRKFGAAAGQRGDRRGRGQGIDVDGIGGAVIENFAAPSPRLEAVMPVPVSAALICVTTEPMPPEKSMPKTVSFAVAVAVLDNGKAEGSSTRTSVIVCGVLVAVSV